MGASELASFPIVDGTVGNVSHQTAGSNCQVAGWSNQPSEREKPREKLHLALHLLPSQHLQSQEFGRLQPILFWCFPHQIHEFPFDPIRPLNLLSRLGRRGLRFGERTPAPPPPVLSGSTLHRPVQCRGLGTHPPRRGRPVDRRSLGDGERLLSPVASEHSGDAIVDDHVTGRVWTWR